MARLRNLCCYVALTLALVPAAAGSSYEFPTASAVTRASELKGRVVETRDGEELGRVHDFAVDLASGTLAYVVVSVGSFLIDDSLIAVAPEALRDSADADGRLVLEADAASLRAARRFADGAWPRRADVLADQQAPGTAEAATEEAVATAPARGSATISSRSRTATLSAGERSIRFLEPPERPSAQIEAVRDAAARPAPTTRFRRLDRDGDGTLNRAEIAHEMGRGDRFADIDLDASGSIDEGEFDAMQNRRGPGGD